MTDRRLGQWQAEGTVYPLEYATGGAYVHNGGGVTTVALPDNFFYVLPPGTGRVSDEVHAELVSAATGGQMELPFESGDAAPKPRKKNTQE